MLTLQATGTYIIMSIYKRRSKSAADGGLIVRHRGYTYPFPYRESITFSSSLCTVQFLIRLATSIAARLAWTYHRRHHYSLLSDVYA